MKLATKISLSAVAVFSFGIVGGGYSIIEQGYTNELSRTSAVLDTAAKSIRTSEDKLSAALLLSDEVETPLTISFVDMDSQLTTIADSSVQISQTPELTLMREAAKSTQLIREENEYQLRTVDLGQNEFVLIATSTEAAHDARDSNLLFLAVVAAFTIALAGAGITFLIRRDLKSVISTIAATAEQERETRQSMQTFMGDASHELRTPLTVIKGYAELLAQSGAKTSAEQRTKAYQRIVEQVNRMDDTITGLLQLAEVGSISSNSFVRLDLAELVGKSAEDLRTLSPKRSVTVEAPSLVLPGSVELLTRLLDNAIGNINRHTKATDAVQIELKRRRKHALLIIEDAGPGLPAEAYDKGIQGFQRFDESRSRETGGTGLGMTLMKSIVEAHHGSMTVSPSALGGLKIEIALPLN